MKNFLFIISFVLIIPFSIGNSESKGCHSSENEKTERKTDNEKSETKDKKEDNCSASGNNSRFFCYPYSNNN